jgi:FkbM family methyltransferase
MTLLARFRPAYYEPQQVRDQRIAFYRQFIRKGDLVFDVGANLGNRTDAFLAIRARVVAVEPQAECVRVLRRRFRHCELVVEPVALGATPGEVTLYLTSVSAIASASVRFIEATHASGRFAAYHYSRTASVPMTTLDALVRQHGEPAFIKIDVEGYEPSVLAGLSTRPAALRALSYEFTPELLPDALDCAERLAHLGAVYANYSLGESMKFANFPDFSIQDLPAKLSQFANSDIFGDVYVRWD